MSAPRRRQAFALALALGLVVGVTSAQAVSLPIPNSGFETPCGAPAPPYPCNWGGTSGSTVSWDSTYHHAGLHSLALNSIGTPGIVALSSCVVPASGSTTYNLETWYRTTAAVNYITMYLNTYQSNNCTGSPFAPLSTAATNSPNTAGTWTRLTGQTTTDAGVQSVKVLLSFSCAATCPAGLVVYFDDVVAQTEPLAVIVGSLAARPAAHGVLVRWHTGTEVDLIGFRVYRSHGHSWRPLGHTLIAAKGSVTGASYRFLDKSATRSVAYRYRIKAINRDGTLNWFGPVRVA